MTNDVIHNIIFLTILQIRKKNNRADIDSNIKLMVKNSDEKIINERNRNTDSLYQHGAVRHRSAKITL